MTVSALSPEAIAIQTQGLGQILCIEVKRQSVRQKRLELWAGSGLVGLSVHSGV